MNHGPLIFLGLLAAFVASWWGLVFSPQVQVGSQQPVTMESGAYPAQRPGLAAQGREVYVANGCVQCHGQQVHQDGYVFDVVVTSGGTNPAVVATLLQEIVPALKGTEVVTRASEKSPQMILKSVARKTAADTQAKLAEAGAGVQAVFIPLGPDMDRQWGPRRTVGADYLYDAPVQVGHSRLGPDLSNIGARMTATTDANWQLLHLYDPRTVVKGSMMPAYRYLFEVRKAGKHPAPEALSVPEPYAPKAGEEVVPKPEALQLVAYLQSLRFGPTLLEAPRTELPAAPAEVGTNAPVGASTPSP